jgi:hypothetical protein
MAVRNDVQVNWVVSPRIITVLAPSTEITIQDLLDTCRELEDDPFTMVYDHLASAAGKENLGGGVKVGITLTLRNAVLAFEARPGPTYEQCRVSGGNLVAVDGYGADISPIYPTSFTQVLTTSSSSATLQELQDIQYSSFDNAVHVDLINGYSGTTYPIGTPRQPSNNFADAISIANTRGFRSLNVLGDATLTSGLDFSDKTIVGESVTKTHLIINSGANVEGCEFYNSHVKGVLDGYSYFNSCILHDVNYVDGVVNNCILTGTLTLFQDAVFLNCSSGAHGIDGVNINFQNLPIDLTMTNFSGKMSLFDLSSPNTTILDMASGVVEIDNSITDGYIIVRGVATLIDNSTANVDSSGLLSPQSISNAVWDEPVVSHNLAGSMGEAIANAGLTPEQAKQLLLIFVNSL